MIKSVTDLVMGLLCTPLFIFLLQSEITGRPNCVIFMIPKKLGVLVYVCCVVAMSTLNFEKYMAILHPLTHRTKVTRTSLLIHTRLLLFTNYPLSSLPLA